MASSRAAVAFATSSTQCGLVAHAAPASELADMTADYYPLAVERVIRETDDAVSYVLQIPTDKPELFAYRPGQFVTVEVGLSSGEVPRCYSLSSVPGHDPQLKITVKRVPGGAGSNWLLENIQAGDVLPVKRPAGMFVSRRPNEDLALFAAGSGITPIISILKSKLLASAKSRVSLFYANRDERSVIFRDELNELARCYPERLQIVHWLETVQGRPSTKIVAAYAGPAKDQEYFICGPGPFMDVVESALLGLGVHKKLVHLERFVFNASAPARIAAQERTAERPITELEVTLEGETRVVPWRANEFMLDALQKAGLRPPYSCRAGSCGACICTVRQGDVEMQSNAILEEIDIAEKLALACQSVPRTPQVKVEF